MIGQGVTGNDDNVDGDGGVMGDNENVDGNGMTGYDNDNDGDGAVMMTTSMATAQRATRTMMMAMA